MSAEEKENPNFYNVKSFKSNQPPPSGHQLPP